MTKNALETPTLAPERRPAAPALRTLAVGPTGMSISTCVEPAAAFLDSTEATS